MKHLNKFLSILVMGAVMFSCNPGFEEDTATDFDPFVQFTSSAVTALENDPTPVSFTVQLVGPIQSSDVSVTFDIVETNVSSGVDYTWTGSSSVTIPAGELSATFSVTTIDNDVITEGAKSVVLTISEVSSGFGISTEGAGRSTLTITITEDDFWCPRNLMSEFVLEEEDLGYSTSPVSIEIVTSPEACYEFDIIGGAGTIFGTTNIRMNGFKVVEDSPESMTGTIEDGDFMVYPAADAAGDTPYTTGGNPYIFTITNGVYNLETGVITMDYVLSAGGTVFFPGTFVYDAGS